MKRGKYQKSKPHSLHRKPLLALVCLVLMVGLSVGGTLAYFSHSSAGVTNTFSAGTVGADIRESFNGTEKSSITVTNPGTSPVYVRIRLVSYWKDDDSIAPKASPSLAVSLNSGWTYMDGYYYYTSPLAGGSTTSNMLADSLYMGTTEEGYKQVIEVLAETVQATPAEAVSAVWGVNPSAFITG